MLNVTIELVKLNVTTVHVSVNASVQVKLCQQICFLTSLENDFPP